MFSKIIKNTSIVSSGTLASRVLGFVRDVMLANFFGTSAVFEAFLVAFRLPNLFRSVFAEGFVDSVATPALAEYNQEKDKLFSLGNNLISLSLVTASIATILGIIFSSQLVFIIAPGFSADPYKFNLAVSFTRITFVYLLLIAISSDMSSMLCAMRKFFVTAINPIFLNLAFIVGITAFSQIFKNYTLVVAVVIAGILEVIFPFIFLKKEGFNLKINFIAAIKDSRIIKMLKLFVPRIWASTMYHVNIFVDTIFCSLAWIVGDGAIAAMYYANRLIQFPLALIAISLSQVAVVDLSAYHKQGRMDDFKKLLVFIFQNMMFFVLPAAFIFLCIPEVIIDVLFRRGEFSSNSLALTSSVLFFYSLGLFFFCSIKLLVSAFYALKETSTPAKTVTLAILVNVVLSAILMFPLRVGGVALGSSIAAFFNCWLLYRALVVKIGPIDWQDTASLAIRLILLSLLIGLLSRFIWENLLFSRYLKASIMIVADITVFVWLGSMFKFRQISFILEKIKSKI